MIAEISIAEFEPHVASGALVIDVRETDEYISGHVPNAISIPLSTLPDRIDEFRHDLNELRLFPEVLDDYEDSEVMDQ